jgi:hypothetical protein
MSDSNPTLLVSAAFGSPYLTLIRRLSKTADKFHVPLLYKTYSAGTPEADAIQHEHKNSPYCFKLKILMDIIGTRGYSRVVWADSAVYVVKDPQPFFDLLDDNPVLFLYGGDQLVQYVNEATLRQADVERKDLAAAKAELISGSLFGFDFEQEVARKFLEEWRWYETKGYFKANGQKPDGTFVTHRHDEAVASVLLHKMGIESLLAYDYFQGRGPGVMFRADKDVNNTGF